ncbi:hypothetical protein OHR68_40175 [Spirillospora sp. NBC_00431]
MDELRVVKEAYGEPAAPTMREMGEARSRMFEEPPRRRARFGWRVKAGAGVVAVGAATAVATAVAIAVAGSGTSAPKPSPRGGVDLEKGAVLAAAEKAELQPTGKYWHDDTVSGQAYVVRAKTGNYAIFGAQNETFHWAGVKSGMGEAYYGRDLPAHPQTPRDAELWRKAGSPSSIRVWSNDHYATYSTKATRWRSDGPNVGVDPKGGGAFVDGKSAEELRELPTDPGLLAKMFLDVSMAKPGLPNGGRAVLPSLKISRASAVLSAPIPPKVRSGLMKALAAQPGVHEIGRVTDPLGRTDAKPRPPVKLPF